VEFCGETMFRGLNAINLDTKGRLTIPTRYRQSLQDICGGKLIITIDTEQQCLLVYPTPSWLEIEKKVAALPSFHPTARRIQRLLIGHATEVEMDANGRLLVPPPLRDFAELDKKVALVGQGNKFECWSDAQWQASRDEWLQERVDIDSDLPDEVKNLSL
tara:strand:+ start:18671 stop:19150 length:480 start_codon:yes stop_codon:yes gene_type:complete